MSIDFEGGRSFANEGDLRTKLTAERLREGLADVSTYIPREVVLVPSIRVLTELLGVSPGALFTKGFETYSEIVEHATGLSVISHRGLVLHEAGAVIEPLVDHLDNKK